MGAKLVFLSLFLWLNINFCLAQENIDSTQNSNADTTENIVKKRFRFRKEKRDTSTTKKEEIVKYQLSEEEIRLRNAHPDSLSKRERKKLDKSYKKERKFYEKHGNAPGNEGMALQAFLKQNPEYEGMFLNENDIRTLTRINKKYTLTPEDKLLRASNPDTIGLFQRFKLAKTYRKEYLRHKKLQKFWKKRIYSMQPPDARERMKAHEKKVKRRDRRRRWEMRKKRLLNLFR